MKNLKTLTLFALILLVLCAGSAKAVDISGTITTTLVITTDSQLVGDVTCSVENAPCISFGASGITLMLNGFTITGRVSPPANCATPANFVPEDGISVINRSSINIFGPGLVQNFRRHGIFLNGNPATNTATRITVRRITSNQNCFSGLQVSGVTNSDVIENVSVRNAIASLQLPCGGNCITNSHNNRIERNVFSGNGSVSGTQGNNDFGAGLVGNSSGNLLQENTIGGNANGIMIQALTVNNIVRRNIIVGNPAIQVSNDYGATTGFDVLGLPRSQGRHLRSIGFDILDFSPAGANTFDSNLCLTYSGATNPAPCPSIPRFAGHQNPPDQ